MRLAHLTRRPSMSTAVIASVGFVGAALIAWASYVVGALPHHHLDRTVATGPYRWPYEIGVALLVVAWLALGRLVLDSSISGMTGRLCWAAAIMAAPLLMAAPVTSQDVWAYLGQANVAAHGLDPYSVGPGAVPGPYSHAVAHEWLDTGSPYGPLWLWVCRLVVEVTGPHPWAGMFVLRALAVGGIVATGAALVRLSRAIGGRPQVSVWLLVGPFPLLMMVGAVHNDAVMLALLVGGVTVAATSASRRRALLIGAALVGAAGAIKVIALVALPLLPLFWFRYADPDRIPNPDAPVPVRRWVAAAAVSATAGLVTVLVLGVLFGFGLGWVRSVGDGTIGVRWLSLPQQIGNLLHLLVPDHIADRPADRYGLLHPIGLAFLAVALGAVLVTARRRPPIRSLTMALIVIVVSSPAPRTWYLLWPLVFLAADRLSRRLLVAAAAACATIALWFPASVRPQPPEWALLALFAPLAVLAARITRDAGPLRPARQPVGPGPPSTR